jgi:hypothetical protein
MWLSGFDRLCGPVSSLPPSEVGAIPTEQTLEVLAKRLGLAWEREMDLAVEGVIEVGR